jgi:cupin fold WbuC family metalloprotein
MREAAEALFNTEALLQVDGHLVEELKRRAHRSPTRRFRLCLHRSSEELVQEMIVVHCRENYSRPHKHSVPLTYIVLEGALRVFLFDDAGVVTQRIDLVAFGKGRAFTLHIDAGTWYMPVCGTPQVVFYEAKRGPFRRDSANLWAPWAPAEDDHEGIASYRRALGIIHADSPGRS